MSSNDGSLSFKERMASAGTGSILTSLILTPMDVVRIRLQQQELLPDCSCNIDERSLLSNTVSKRPQTLLTSAAPQNVFWQTACFQDLNCKNSAPRLNGIWDATRQISRMEGILTLWRGISLTLLMAIPANVVYYTAYETIRDSSPLSTIYPALNPVLCGGLARLLAATSVAPLELIKTRFQSIPRSSKNTRSSLIFKDLLLETSKEFRTNGYRALFKGLEITLWRDVPFSAIYWGSYEFCKKKIWVRLEGSWVHFLNSFTSGCISGAVAALLTHPFDVGKTRLQIALMQETPSAKGQSMFRYLSGICRQEGARALFVGLTPRIGKIAPSCAIMISTYEISKRIYSNRGGF